MHYVDDLSDSIFSEMDEQERADYDAWRSLATDLPERPGTLR